jgi:hypothetical protein
MPRPLLRTEIRAIRVGILKTEMEIRTKHAKLATPAPLRGDRHHLLYLKALPDDEPPPDEIPDTHEITDEGEID